MRRVLLLWLAFAAVGCVCAAGQSILHERRSSASDLEVGGELKGLPAGATRYMRRDDLLRLPQEHFVAQGDDNLKRGMQIQGVALARLARLIASDPDGAMMVAICSDEYRGNYPREYVAAHHPVLVLKIDGKGPKRWPKSEYGGPLGPYLVTHPGFKPAFKVLSHEDEAQVPFAVTRIEFRREARVYGAIRAIHADGGEWAADSEVGQGFAIARQDCFRCHNMGVEGGTMAGESWIELGTMAAEDGAKFRQVIRNPASVKADAKMPAHADYDDTTLDALTAYFRTFGGRAR